MTTPPLPGMPDGPDPAVPRPRPRAICGVCGRKVVVRPDGQLRAHGYLIGITLPGCNGGSQIGRAANT